MMGYRDDWDDDSQPYDVSRDVSYDMRGHDAWRSGLESAPDRTVTYVVLVDGRVVDHWDEPLRRSPWRNDPRVERTLHPWREAPALRPATPAWQATVRWLEHLLGGPAALIDLTTEPLPDEGFVLPAGAVGDGDLVARFRRATEVLDGLADLFFDVELRTAFRRALAAVGMELLAGRQPEDPVMTAAGVCWAVARANGALSPAGRVTLKSIAPQLRLSSFPTAKGKEVARLLGSPQPPWVQRPPTLVDLEPLGRTDVLTARTRRDIVALREAASAAEAHEAARERARACDLGLDVPEAS